MKELSIEEKSYVAYKELINRLEDVKNAIKKQNYGIAMDILCNPYPEFQITASTELKESEDERMRNAAINACKYMVDNFENSTKQYKDAIAWLKKQGEKGTNGNERDIPNLEPPLTIKHAREVLGIKQNDDWSEEDKTGLTNTIIMLKEGASLHFNKKDITKAVDWLKSLKDKIQPKQEWSEEDKEMLNVVIKSCEQYGNEYAYYWLKSLKDRVLPQPKQEWSEEDENRMKKVMHILSLDGRISNAELQSIYDWLKSLRPQNTWKPSDEQMEAVKSAALDVAKFSSRSEQLRLENEPYYKALVSLYNDLKKLREE